MAEAEHGFDAEQTFVRMILENLKTTLKAEIDADAWATLNSDTSRPFDKPGSSGGGTSAGQSPGPRFKHDL